YTAIARGAAAAITTTPIRGLTRKPRTTTMARTRNGRKRSHGYFSRGASTHDGSPAGLSALPASPVPIAPFGGALGGAGRISPELILVRISELVLAGSASRSMSAVPCRVMRRNAPDVAADGTKLDRTCAATVVGLPITRECTGAVSRN